MPLSTSDHHDDADSSDAITGLSNYKTAIRAWADQMATERAIWSERNRFFYHEDMRTLRSLAGKAARVMEIGCATGSALAALAPEIGVGIDLSSAMIEEAKRTHPQYRFYVGDIEDKASMESLAETEGCFDVILIVDAIGLFEDVDTALNNLHAFCHSKTRILVAYYKPLWQPILALAERLKLKMPQPVHTYMSSRDIRNMLALADFEVVRFLERQIIPRRGFGLGPILNSLDWIPGLRALCVRDYLMARSLLVPKPAYQSVSIIVPCRNERGNIGPILADMPVITSQQEVIFVEGNSCDGTWEEIERLCAQDNHFTVRAYRQEGVGKADAVWKGFDEAEGDILIIYDGDMTINPSDLIKFWRAIQDGRGEIINGSRMVYPIESSSMRALNYMANRFFSCALSTLTRTRMTDTLCGTKCVAKSDFNRMKERFMNIKSKDPFGDFFLLLSSCAMGLKITEVPVRYQPRIYGKSQISRFRDGLSLFACVRESLKMLRGKDRQ